LIGFRHVKVDPLKSLRKAYRLCLRATKNIERGRAEFRPRERAEHFAAAIRDLRTIKEQIEAAGIDIKEALPPPEGNNQMEGTSLISNAWLTKVDGCYWLHVKASDETIASINLSAEEGPFKETFEKWAEEQLSQRFSDSSSH
jgi:hypothetical protein